MSREFLVLKFSSRYPSRALGQSPLTSSSRASRNRSSGLAKFLPTSDSRISIARWRC